MVLLYKHAFFARLSGKFLLMICASTIAAPSLNFYLVARAIEFPIADIDTITKVAGQMGRLGHDGREESDCARS